LLVAWSLVVAVCLFAYIARLGHQHWWVWTGTIATALVGAHLGWHRRLGSVFVAPLFSWFFAFFPVIVASMVHWGLVEGIFVGLFLATFGWIVIGGAQFVALLVVAVVFRSLAVLFRRHRDDGVVIIRRDETI